MALEMEIASLFGPLHLTNVDWNNTHHRRSIAASLVKAVYTLERDRQNNRHGHQALAPPWWNFFHFQKITELIDITDSSIFAAIFKFKQYSSENNSPKYIIAFRGTLFSPRDAKLNFHLISNTLHESARYQNAMQIIKHLVLIAGATDIWLAGHSLGSAMALLIGKKMAQINCPIETYLFNPPFLSSTPIGWISDPNLKDAIRFTRSVIKAGFLVATQRKVEENNDQFVGLSEWIPYLFVNPDDPICSEYIGYFEYREKLEKIGGGRIERLAMKISIRNLVLGKDYSEPLHLLPNAFVTINVSRSLDLIEAHRIHQWWRPDLNYRSKLYGFR